MPSKYRKPVALKTFFSSFFLWILVAFLPKKIRAHKKVIILFCCNSTKSVAHYPLSKHQAKEMLICYSATQDTYNLQPKLKVQVKLLHSAISGCNFGGCKISRVFITKPR